MNFPRCEAAILFYESFTLNCSHEPRGGGGTGDLLHFQFHGQALIHLSDNRVSPVSRDPGIAVPGSRLTGLRIFHVIAFAGPGGSLALRHTQIKVAPVSRVYRISHQPG